MADLIDRYEAINAICGIGCGTNTMCAAPCGEVQAILELPSAQTDLITKMQNGIKATDADDPYSCGMRNGIRWCMSLIDDKEPLYENCPHCGARMDGE